MSSNPEEIAATLERVKEIIAKNAAIDGLTADGDFYDAGVSSAMALPILLDLEDEYGISIPDDIFISARSPRALAEMIASLRT